MKRWAPLGRGIRLLTRRYPTARFLSSGTEHAGTDPRTRNIEREILDDFAHIHNAYGMTIIDCNQHALLL